MSDVNFGEGFEVIYKKAKVGSNELLLAKGTIVLPIFNANSKRVFDIIELNKEQLIGTGFTRFKFNGYLMNAELDFTFHKYILHIAQRTNSRIVHIDFLEMLRNIGVSSNHYSYYREEFDKHLVRGFESKYEYEYDSGVRVMDGFYSRHQVNTKDFYTVEISKTVASSICSEFNQKVSYIASDSIVGDSDSKSKVGVASRLLDIIKVLAFNSDYELRLNLYFKLLNLQGTRESKVKVLNRAIDKLIGVGFIVSCVDDKRGGKSIYSKNLKINKKYSLEKKSHAIVQEESPELLKLTKELIELEAQDDNLDDIFGVCSVINQPVISAVEVSDKSSFEYPAGTDISGFDVETDIDSWVDQSDEPYFAGKIYFDDERDLV